MTADDLNKQQLTQFGRLHKVKDKLNQLCEGLGLLNLKVYTETSEDLKNMQNNQFNRLDKIRNKLNSMCDDLSMSNLKVAEFKQHIVVSTQDACIKGPVSEQNKAKINIFNRIKSKVNVKNILNFLHFKYFKLI